MAMRSVHMRTRVRYLMAALLLGVAWWLALLIPEATRNVLLSSYPPLHFALLCAVSVVLAIVFRGPIAKASASWRFILLSLFLPFVGAAFFIWLASFAGWLLGGSDIPFWVAALMWIYLMPIQLGAIGYAAYYVIIPMGLLSQYTMHSLTRVGRNGAPGHAAT